jgi:MYXO-CTERM domain-containing protein
MYVRFHANSAGTLQLSGSLATGTVGSSSVAIHQVLASGGAASVTQPAVGDCYSGPFGACVAVRFPVDSYALDVPGPYAVAIHVIDGLGASEAPATVGSLNDDAYDPAPKQNAAVIGAAVYRDSKQSYVVASSAQDGLSTATMTYGVPGTSPSRHVVFDAPENADGSSVVTAVSQGDRCAISITSGAGFTGHPLMFEVASAADECTVTESTDVAPGGPPPGGGVGGNANSGGAGPTAGAGGATNGKDDGGCGCRAAPANSGAAFGGVAALLLFAVRRRRRHPPSD